MALLQRSLFHAVFDRLLQCQSFIHCNCSSFVCKTPVTPQHLIKERCRLTYMYDPHALCVTTAYKKILRIVPYASSHRVTNSLKPTIHHTWALRPLLESGTSAFYAPCLTTRLDWFYQSRLNVAYTGKQHSERSQI
jgi:hypothetical protein